MTGFAVVCLILLLAASKTGPPPAPAASASQGRLLASAIRQVEERAELYSYIVDLGSGQVVPIEQRFSNPDLSPVAEEVLYDEGDQEWPPAKCDIWKADLEGRNAVNLSARAGVKGVNCCPSWSGDGRLVAFQHSEPAKGQRPCEVPFQVWVMNADGTGARRVSPDEPRPYTGSYQLTRPRCSPDGSRVLYGSFQKSIIVDIKSGDTEVLHGLIGGGDWSPDGSRLVSGRFYEGWVHGKGGIWNELVVTDVTGRHRDVLVRQFVSDADIRAHGAHLGESVQKWDVLPALGPRLPRWSPSGERIAFLAAIPFDPQGPHFRQQVELWIYDLKSEKLARVTKDANEDNWLSWR